MSVLSVPLVEFNCYDYRGARVHVPENLYKFDIRNWNLSRQKNTFYSSDKNTAMGRLSIVSVEIVPLMNPVSIEALYFAMTFSSYDSRVTTN
jgi:hypothetical protein